jgi:hypothetical protein
MRNSEPFELISGPLEAYVAPVGTAFPAVDEAPAVAWVQVGTSGADDYTPDGVTVTPSQATNTFRGAKSTGPRKTFRTEEDLKIGLTIVDHTLEQIQHALNGNTITTTPAGAGTPGTKKIGLSRGSSVKTMALLLRGPSPYMADGVLQWEVPLAQQTGSPTLAYKNGDPVGWALEWTTLVDPAAATDDEKFGRIVAQTHVANP